MKNPGEKIVFVLKNAKKQRKTSKISKISCFFQITVKFKANQAAKAHNTLKHTVYMLKNVTIHRRNGFYLGKIDEKRQKMRHRKNICFCDFDFYYFCKRKDAVHEDTLVVVVFSHTNMHED